MAIADPVYFYVESLALSASAFTAVPSDATSIGDCYALDLEETPGAREALGRLGDNAVAAAILQENDLPPGQRAGCKNNRGHPGRAMILFCR